MRGFRQWLGAVSTIARGAEPVADATASNASAIALKATLTAAVPTQYTATANMVFGTTVTDMNGRRQAIIELAQSLG